MSFINDLTQRRFFPIALLACLALAIALVKLQPKMEHEPSAALITSVNVIAVKPYHVRHAILGYGTVEPVTCAPLCFQPGLLIPVWECWRLAQPSPHPACDRVL
jgi:hypothetical protein